MMSRDTDLEITGIEPEIEQALGEFRTSVKAWSEAALRRPMAATAPAPRGLAGRGRLAWAMGLLLAMGATSGAIYENHHQRVLTWQAQQQEMRVQQQRAQAAKRAAEMDQLMANVDHDVSQEVPDALEPLAQMMTVSGSK